MEEFKDKNGIVIKDGDTIYNKHNNPTHEKIVNISGVLSFKEDGCPLTRMYNTEQFWEVVR